MARTQVGGWRGATINAGAQWYSGGGRRHLQGGRYAGRPFRVEQRDRRRLLLLFRRGGGRRGGGLGGEERLELRGVELDLIGQVGRHGQT